MKFNKNDIVKVIKLTHLKWPEDEEKLLHHVGKVFQIIDNYWVCLSVHGIEYGFIESDLKLVRNYNNWTKETL